MQYMYVQLWIAVLQFSIPNQMHFVSVYKDYETASLLMFAEIANITSNIVSSALASFPPLCLVEQLNCLGVPAIC